MKFGTQVKQSQPFNRDYFHDNWCPICDFMAFWIFLKKGRGSSNFCKIRAVVLKLHTNILHPSRNFGIEFGQNRLKRSNYFRFWIFWEFFQNCLTQANFDLSSWNFVRKCINTEWCLILNFVKIGGDLNFRRIWIFLFFLPLHQISKIRCIHEASFVRKPKSSNVYFPKERTSWNRWGSNMGMSIHILFYTSSIRERVMWKFLQNSQIYLWWKILIQV